MTGLREDAEKIITYTIDSAKPDQAVGRALQELPETAGKLILVAMGKAGWQMAKAAKEVLQERIDAGICITKYDHVMAEIAGIECYEAGHPVPDENSVKATRRAEEMVKDLTAEDTVLFLISGGGSALFEDPLISLEELQDITKQLLASGADITEMNTLRKRLSAVKGGKFARLCAPAKVFAIVLSDIIGDPLDMIASGPAYPDSSTCEDAAEIVERYHLELSDTVKELLTHETPKYLENVETHITGSVRQLCEAASVRCKELGYEPVFLTASLTCEAREAGSFLASIARDHCHTDHDLAYICGGETVVHLQGHGLGGRNQEIALSAGIGIEGIPNAAVFSVGSDGTDGPTDAAGGYADGETVHKLQEAGGNIHAYMADNDAYHALEKTGGLIITGPTGTNVNDFAVVLIRKA